MPVGLGLDLGIYKQPTTPVAVIRESTIYDFNVGDSFITHNSVPAGSKITIRGVEYPIEPTYFYTVRSDSLDGRLMKEPEQHRILLNNEYRLYKMIGNELVNLSLGNMVEGVVSTVDSTGAIVTNNTAIANLVPDKKYIITGVSGLTGQPYTIIQVVNGLKVVKDLAANSIIFNERTATFQFYKDGILQDYSQPVPYSFYCGTNIKLHEDDGITKRVLPRNEVIPFLPYEGGYPLDFPATNAVNFSIVLNGQTDKTQNVVYIFRELTPNAGFSWKVAAPFDVANFQRPHGFDSALFQRGDGYQGIVYRLFSDPPFYNAPNKQYVTRLNWVPKSSSTNLKWVKVDPGADVQKTLLERIELLESLLEPLLTKQTAITIKNKCTVIIDGSGDINIWSGAIAGDSFRISDPNLKLTTISPSVVPENGYTINNETGPYSLSAVKADWEYDRNLFFRLDNTKNWIVGRL